MTSAIPMPSQFGFADFKRAACSLGLRTGAQVYLSSVSAASEDGKVAVHGGMAAQARTAYDKIAAALDAAGKTFGDVVKLVEYVSVDAFDQYQEAAGVRQAIFGTQRTAINTVVVKRLPNPEALIAVEATAGPRVATATTDPWLPFAAESEGIVYLPNMLALDANKNLIGPGDIVRQTEVIFEHASKVLRSLGIGMDHVVMTVDHPTPQGRVNYRELAKIRQAFLGPVYPGAAGIVMPRLAAPDAVIQYDFTATRDQPIRIDMGWQRYDTLTYSAIVRAGKLLFMSGQSSRDPASGVMQAAGDVLAQSEYIYGKIIKMVEAAGGHAGNIVSLVEYVAPRAAERYAGIGDVRGRVFRSPPPVASSVICEALLRREMEIEIVPFAMLDWERQ